MDIESIIRMDNIGSDRKKKSTRRSSSAKQKKMVDKDPSHDNFHEVGFHEIKQRDDEDSPLHRYAMQ